MGLTLALRLERGKRVGRNEMRAGDGGPVRRRTDYETVFARVEAIGAMHVRLELQSTYGLGAGRGGPCIRRGCGGDGRMVRAQVLRLNLGSLNQAQARETKRQEAVTMQ